MFCEDKSNKKAPENASDAHLVELAGKIVR